MTRAELHALVDELPDEWLEVAAIELRPLVEYVCGRGEDPLTLSAEGIRVAPLPPSPRQSWGIDEPTPEEWERFHAALREET